MTIDSFRQLVALRYTAESVDEVNVFLAKALEIQVRLLKQGAVDRLAGFCAGAAASLVAAFTLGDDFLAPALVLCFFFVLMALSAGFNLLGIRKKDQELTLEHSSVRDYLIKATRDRLENRVTIAIQNRKAAARLLESDPDSLEDDDKRLLKDSIDFWGARIRQVEKSLCDRTTGDIWEGDETMLKRICTWIDREFEARPIKS